MGGAHGCHQRACDPAAHAADGSVSARGLRVFEGWTLPLWQQLLHWRLQHLSLRTCDRETRGGERRHVGITPARCRWTAPGSLSCVTPRKGFMPLGSTRSRETWARSPSSARRWRPNTRNCAAGSRRPRPPCRTNRRSSAGANTSRCARFSSSPCSRWCRGTGTRPRAASPRASATRWGGTQLQPGQHPAEQQRTHFSADLHHSRWTTGVAWNEADFYDLFGPTKRSVAGYNGYIGYNLPLDFEPPKRPTSRPRWPTTAISTRCQGRRMWPRHRATCSLSRRASADPICVPRRARWTSKLASPGL